jgi:hypothetical protein
LKDGLVAWQGFVLPVPSDWTPTTISGKRAKGYLRFQSPTGLFLHARWEQANGSSPDSAVSRYLTHLKKSTRKGQLDFTQDGSSFEWHGGIKGYGACIEGEGRLLIVEVAGEKEQSFKRFARQVFQEIAFQRASTWRWSILGLDARLPSYSVLHSVQLLSGKVSLAFAARGDTTQIDRWALAEQLLQGQSFEDWCAGASNCIAHSVEEGCVFLRGDASPLKRMLGYKVSATARYEPERNSIQLCRVEHRSGAVWIKDVFAQATSSH